MTFSYTLGAFVDIVFAILEMLTVVLVEYMVDTENAVDTLYPDISVVNLQTNACKFLVVR